MKPFFVSSLLILLNGLPVFAQQNKFTFPGVITDKHTLYTYVKSNWDGSHASRIFLYVSGENRLESFKWSPGDEWATLVTAGINWKMFTVTNFTNHRIFKDGRKQQLAELHQQGHSIYFRVGDMSDSMKLDHPFWQSYDFDFAGLGFIWRALNDKKSGFWFHIADAGMIDDKVGFLNKGKVEVHYEGMESLDGTNCMRYRIDGPGLQYKGGHIWINATTHMIERYKIQLPDEEGFDNGMLKLERTQKMPPSAWEKFIQEKMKE